jgi:hypothetical protein
VVTLARYDANDAGDGEYTAFRQRHRRAGQATGGKLAQVMVTPGALCEKLKLFRGVAAQHSGTGGFRVADRGDSWVIDHRL